jgi:hypothetical protein
MAPVPVGGERGVDEEDLVGGRVRVDGHAGGVDGVLRGPDREELCVVHEAVLHAASERFQRIFSAQVAQDARFRGQGGGDGGHLRLTCWCGTGRTRVRLCLAHTVRSASRTQVRNCLRQGIVWTTWREAPLARRVGCGTGWTCVCLARTGQCASSLPPSLSVPPSRVS